MSNFVEVNGSKIHFLDRDGGSPPLICLPGLTANAHFFDGLISRGLSPRLRTIALDFRGRGLSDKPESGYEMAVYAADVHGVLDALGIEQAVICGHSFGALVGFVLAAQDQDKFPGLVIIDSSHLLITARTVQLVKASLDRLGVLLPSMEVYLDAIKQMPFLVGYWDNALENYYRRDVETFADGSVKPLTAPHAIAETIDHEFAEPWEKHINKISQPVLLLNAPGPYGPAGTPPILTEKMARETAAMFQECDFQQVPGNHITMLFGVNADFVMEAISSFVNQLTVTEG